MKHYVAGFMFNSVGNQIALVKKKKPAWQAERYNAIGGKIEENETPLEAMVREFQEETGLFWEDWENVVILKGNEWEVFFFRAFTDEIKKVRAMEDEPIDVFSLSSPLGGYIRIIENLNWLIPLHLDRNLQLPITIQELNS